jgi:Protein of unknown function (DUF1360)
MSLVETRPPYRAYAAILGLYAAGLAGAGAFGRALERDPQCQTALDLGVLGLATFKVARTLSRASVASFVRQPFVRGDARSGDEEPLRTGGFEEAIGELVTCTRCIGTWAAAGLTSTQILAPRFGRLLTWSLGAAAINDFLQARFATLTDTAND